MVALLATGWTGTLRDIAYKATFQHYGLAVFLYVLMLMVLGKVLGLGLDYYSFRLEHRYQLSNLRLRAWIWDEAKGFLVGVVLAGIVAELLYFIMREAPAALVADRLGGVSGIVRAAGATGAGGSVSNFLQVRAAGK